PLTTVWIECRSMRIKSHLEAAALQVRHRVNKVVEVDPRRHRAFIETRISRRHAKKDYFLARDVNQFAQQIGKDFRQPWTTCKYEVLGHDLRARRGFD